MRIRTVIAVSLAILGVVGDAVGWGQTGPAKAPPGDAVAKLIAQLGAADFRTRQQASDELAKLGTPALPVLRKAALAKSELEFKRRIQLVVARIEGEILKAEDKQWQGLDAARQGVKIRLGKILARTPALSDDQVVSAIYLMTVSRRPAGEELARAKKQFAAADSRSASHLRLARALAQSKEFSKSLAAANGDLIKAQKVLAGVESLAMALARLNSDEYQKIVKTVAGALDKGAKTDDEFTDAIFLMVLSRFPDANQRTVCLAHLKGARNRADGAENLVWALMNTREFVFGR